MIKVRFLPCGCDGENELFNGKEFEMPLFIGDTVSNLLMQLEQQLGEPFGRSIFDSVTCSLLQNTIILVNGKAIQTLDELKTVLNSGDLITIGRTYTGG